MADLDPRTNTEDWLEPLGKNQPVIVGGNATQTTTMAVGLEAELEKQLREVLWLNRDLFTWMAADMPRIHPSVMSEWSGETKVR